MLANIDPRKPILAFEKNLPEVSAGFFVCFLSRWRWASKYCKRAALRLWGNVFTLF
jgi:hypothetical protein